MSWQGIQTFQQPAMDLEFHLEASKAKQVGKTITVSKRLHASCGRYFQGRPSLMVFLDHFRLQKTQDSPGIANPLTWVFCHVDSWRRFTRNVVLHESIHVTRVLTS